MQEYIKLIDSGLKELSDFNIIHTQKRGVEGFYVKFNTDFETYNLHQLKRSFLSKPVDFAELFLQKGTLEQDLIDALNADEE